MSRPPSKRDFIAALTEIARGDAPRSDLADRLEEALGHVAQPTTLAEARALVPYAAFIDTSGIRDQLPLPLPAPWRLGSWVMAAPVQRRPRETTIAKLLLELATGRQQRARWWAATRLGRLPARDDIDAALARAMRDDPSIATDAAMALAVHAPADPRPIIAFGRRAVDTLEDRHQAAAAVFAGCLAAAWEREPGVMLEVAALLDAAEARADIAAISGDIRHRIEALPPAGEAAPLWTLSDEKPSDWTSASW